MQHFYLRKVKLKLDKFLNAIKSIISILFCSTRKGQEMWAVQLLSGVQLFVTPWTAAPQSSLSPTPGTCSNSCPLSWWCHPTILSSVILFASCPQSFLASGPFPMSQVANVLELQLQHQFFQWNIQDWFPLGWTVWISLDPKGLSRVFSNTIVQKHQFYGTQLSLWSNSHTHMWLLEKQ